MSNKNYKNIVNGDTKVFTRKTLQDKGKNHKIVSPKNTSTIIVGLQIISSNKLGGMFNILSTRDGIQIYSYPILVELPHLFCW